MLPKDYPKWRTCHYYFSVWSAQKDDKSSSPLEEVLKKISRRTAYFRWSEEKDELFNYRCTECKKYRYGQK